MEYRTLEINAKSAKQLKRVNLISPTKAYAVVSISGDLCANQQQTTPVDRDGHRSPNWNFLANFTVSESLARSNRLSVTFRVRCQGLSGVKDIGEVDVPLSRLIGIEDGAVHSLTCQLIRKPSGKPKGELNISYKWGEKIVSATEQPGQVGAVPAYPDQVGLTSAAGYAYPPPPQGYGYAPPQTGYGYPPVQRPQHPSPTALGGLGALLGKQLAGLVLGDVISEEWW